MAEFTWVPSKGFSSDSIPNVRVAKFGDGYAQRVANGINNLSETWNLSFNSNPLVTADEIIAFLVSKNGVTSFSWRPPGESVDVQVVCSKWSKTYETEFSRNVSATFERVYE